MTKPIGAQVESEALIASRFSARFVDITGQTRALANLAGMKRARQRGRGVEFDEVRAYAAGDDVRAIDWRVTARSGTPHTKLFHEDREQPVIVAIDQRISMKFGSIQCFKSVMAAYSGTLILWSALQAGERVGGVVLGDQVLSDTRPKRSKNAVLSIIGDLVREGSPAPDTATMRQTMGNQLEQLERITRAGARLFLISDFNDLISMENLASLKRLTRKAQVVALSISDPLESQLPIAGHYAVTDGQHHTQLDTRNLRLRETYATQYEEQIAEIVRRFRELRIPMLSLQTSEDPLKRLLTVFPAR